MLQFIGHLHPVLVHLPIGILLLACLFMWQARKDKFEKLQPSINIILSIGMITAIISCITGFVLSKSGDYDEDSLSLHQWMGISVAIVSIATFYCRRKSSLQKWQLPLAFLMGMLILITGHLGGSITHGSDYLTAPLEEMFGTDSVAIVKHKPIPNVQEAYVYNDIIQPIFQDKCYSCHGPKKQKGRLRLDKPDMIMKGGKDGVVVISGKSMESELVKRVLLPREDEHHMSPKEKPQLTGQEIVLLKWWIDNSADFTKKVKEFPQPDFIKPALLALQNNNVEKIEAPDVPTVPVEKADGLVIKELQNCGAIVLPVAQNSNYLSINFLTASQVNDSIIKLLLPLKKQLVWLRLSNTNLGDSSLTIIAQCTNLTKLELDHTDITDRGLKALQSLLQLQSLNLVGTKVSSAGVLQLAKLKQLASLYLFQTNVNKEDWQKMKQAFPKTSLDSGGYLVPLLSTDTTILKPPASVK